MLFTKGFETEEDLREHFDKHHQEIGAVTEEEYEQLADAFLGSVLDADTLECIRPRNGDTIRYNPTRNEFGVLSANNFIRTFYKPTPRDRHKYQSDAAYGLSHYKANCS